MICRTLDRPGKQGGNVFSNGISPDSLITKDSFCFHQIRIGSLDTSRHILIMNRQHQPVLRRTLDDFLHISFRFLTATLHKSRLYSFYAPFFKIRKQFVRCKTITSAGIRKKHTIYIQNNSHIFCVGIFAQCRNIHICLKISRRSKFLIYVKSNASCVKNTLSCIIVSSLGGKILIQKNLITLHRRI